MVFHLHGTEIVRGSSQLTDGHTISPVVKNLKSYIEMSLTQKKKREYIYDTEKLVENETVMSGKSFNGQDAQGFYVSNIKVVLQRHQRFS